MTNTLAEAAMLAACLAALLAPGGAIALIAITVWRRLAERKAGRPFGGFRP